MWNSYLLKFCEWNINVTAYIFKLEWELSRQPIKSVLALMFYVNI